MTGANKAIKHKDLMLVEKQKEIQKLEGVLRKFTQQKDGKSMSIAQLTSQEGEAPNIESVGNTPQVSKVELQATASKTKR